VNLSAHKVMKMMLPVTALLLSISIPLFAHQSAAPDPIKPTDDQQIATLHREIRDLRTQLDSLSARVNIVFSIGGAILAIFLGPLANSAVNRMFERKTRVDMGIIEKPAPEGRRRHPRPSAA
jgi:hypothetical protein